LAEYALSGSETDIERMLLEEEVEERRLDKAYWAPLKKELEAWRHQN
jgi:hypothetical protein